MISWLPVAVVLLAVAVAVTIATPTIAQSSEPPPAGDRRPGAGLRAHPAHRQVSAALHGAGRGASMEDISDVNDNNNSNSTDNEHSEKIWRKAPPAQELAAIKQIERRAEEAAKAQLQSSPASPASRSPVYTNQFVIQVKGGELEARKLAQKHGFVYLNHILGDYYHLEHQRLSKRSASAREEALNISIEDEPQVSVYPFD